MKLRHITNEEFAAMQAKVRGGVRKQAMPSTDLPRVIASAPSPYRSKWEAAYAANLELAKQAGVIKQWWYEPFSLWLPGKVRMKPDFLVQYPLGMERSLQIVEVKGWSRNRRDGMTRLKIAAALFPCFTWTLAYKVKGGGWMEESL
jgi:hypothetical protein